MQRMSFTSHTAHVFRLLCNTCLPSVIQHLSSVFYTTLVFRLLYNTCIPPVTNTCIQRHKKVHHCKSNVNHFNSCHSMSAQLSIYNYVTTFFMSFFFHGFLWVILYVLKKSNKLNTFIDYRSLPLMIDNSCFSRTLCLSLPDPRRPMAKPVAIICIYTSLQNG